MANQTHKKKRRKAPFLSNQAKNKQRKRERQNIAASMANMASPQTRNRKRRLRERANLRPQANTAEMRKELRDFVHSLKDGKPCVDCDGVFHFSAMDFDHVKGGSKIASVSAMIGYGTKQMIIEEVAKCDLRCSNCHRLKTYKRSLDEENVSTND